MQLIEVTNTRSWPRNSPVSQMLNSDMNIDLAPGKIAAGYQMLAAHTDAEYLRCYSHAHGDTGGVPLSRQWAVAGGDEIYLRPNTWRYVDPNNPATSEKELLDSESAAIELVSVFGTRGLYFNQIFERHLLRIDEGIKAIWFAKAIRHKQDIDGCGPNSSYMATYGGSSNRAHLGNNPDTVDIAGLSNYLSSVDAARSAPGNDKLWQEFDYNGTKLKMADYVDDCMKAYAQYPYGGEIRRFFFEMIMSSLVNQKARSTKQRPGIWFLSNFIESVGDNADASNFFEYRNGSGIYIQRTHHSVSEEFAEAAAFLSLAFNPLGGWSVFESDSLSASEDINRQMNRNPNGNAPQRGGGHWDPDRAQTTFIGSGSPATTGAPNYPAFPAIAMDALVKGTEVFKLVQDILASGAALTFNRFTLDGKTYDTYDVYTVLYAYKQKRGICCCCISGNEAVVFYYNPFAKHSQPQTVTVTVKAGVTATFTVIGRSLYVGRGFIS